ncbi:FAD-binding protein [Microaerobacter geothermalis]|uniref:FAD-binding protein n=1 Tax=Microaerobacter geothermalis TaxID=674972 RepID=UPI001F36001D|nr:FAD-binding protein [Microaerobacter geothermalis]MCF6092852.1 FAD-binding protein [Microaerobacter geothermalis]
METLKTNMVILGGGAAGLCAALGAVQVSSSIRLILVSKGLIGKSGSSRMVQGGFNAALKGDDSWKLHLEDTLISGEFINRQDLVSTLAKEAPRCIEQLENWGCFFDRKEGNIHSKTFGGQTKSRTVHRKDFTGIEVTSKLFDQLLAFEEQVLFLQECRALQLLQNESGAVAGVIVFDIRKGTLYLIQAKVVVLATGGAATLFSVKAPPMEKSGDGMALAYRAGAQFVDMEMVQFHPTGLVVPGTLLNGSVVEEGLRGIGGKLLNSQGERFMERVSPNHKECANRDVLTRAIYREVKEGRGTENGGVWLDLRELKEDVIKDEFPNMWKRISLLGKDPKSDLLEVFPTAHYMMGGIRINPYGQTSISGLFSVGEDAGGVHGANRLGGNGIADSVVFGLRVGQNAAIAAINESELQRNFQLSLEKQCNQLKKKLQSPFLNEKGVNPFYLRKKLEETMSQLAGICRNEQGMISALHFIEKLKEWHPRTYINGNLSYNLALQEWLNVENLLIVASLIIHSALLRRESRGAHWREDYPEKNDRDWLSNIVIFKERDQEEDHQLKTKIEPVSFTMMSPETVNSRKSILPPETKLRS